MYRRTGQPRTRRLKMAVAVLAGCLSMGAQAVQLDVGSPDWEVHLDNSIQWTMGWRAQNMDDRIGNHAAFAQGDYKFADKGDMVTNRIQDLIEFQGVYQGRMGFRVSGSLWKDFAYNDTAEQNPDLEPVIGNAYNNGKYGDHVKRFYQQGAEMLDYFVFMNTEVGNTPVQLKLGRFTQYWGNAFFFGFSNIGYSQAGIDYQKGFSQPGTEVKELFMPRKQILVSASLTPELSVSAQYFFEAAANRYPESGTYLGFFDPLFDGPDQWAGLKNAGTKKPDDNNENFGLKVNWSPAWAEADFGLYYRQFDEVDPWPTLINSKGELQATYGEKTKLFGFSMEKSFGLVSTGVEVSYRKDTALNSIPLQQVDEGARGDLLNVITNAFVQLGSNDIWDTGILLAELSFTHLVSVTENKQLYNGEDTANCAGGSWRTGCSTRNALHFAMLFDPQWLQVYPSIDIDTPISITAGLSGNAAYRAGAFYAQDSQIISLGVRATYKQQTSLALQYNSYHWKTGDVEASPIVPGGSVLSGFGGNGPVSLNDRAWWQLTLKSSF